MKQQDKDAIQAMIDKYNIQNPKDIEQAIQDLFGKTLQTLLEKEMDHHLGYEKHAFAPKETTNRRNGTSSKTVQTNHGPVTVQIPRDRQGEFAPQILPKHRRDVSSIEDKVLSMYACGMSTRDIAEQIHSIYGASISADQVSPYDRCYSSCYYRMVEIDPWNRFILFCLLIVCF